MWYDMLLTHCSSQLVKQRCLAAATFHTFALLLPQKQPKNERSVNASPQNERGMGWAAFHV
jgi:hypothetical protein